jgi:hypothetical protein
MAWMEAATKASIIFGLFWSNGTLILSISVVQTRSLEKAVWLSSCHLLAASHHIYIYLSKNSNSFGI